MTSLQVICGFAPPPHPINDPGYAYGLTVIQNQETPKTINCNFCC